MSNLYNKWWNANNPFYTNNKEFTLRVIEKDNYTYIGKAEVGSVDDDAVWQIQRVEDTWAITVLYADWNNKFDNIWSDYENLTYN